MIRAVLFTVLGAELGLGLLSVASQKAEATQQLAQLRSTIKSQTTAFERLSELATNLDELKLKRALLSDVSGGAPVHAMLAELSQVMPEGLVLTKVRYTQHRRIGSVAGEPPPSGRPPPNNTERADELRLTGLAKTDRDIGLMMSRMAASDLFERITLVYSQPVAHGDVLAREFELTCVVPQFE